MPSFSSDARFFGLDLNDLVRQLREPWEGASTWPIFSWLTPTTPVLLLQADGKDAVWQDGQRTYASPSAPPTEVAFTAIEVPEDLMLRRSVRLPAMSAADRERALALEARTASPFAADDLCWGIAPHAGQAGAVVLASRKQLLAYQSALASRLPANAAPEFWVFDASGHPVVLRGFGEPRRLAFVARRRRAGVTLLASAAVIAIFIALTPSLKLKLRADQALVAYDALTRTAAPAIAQREALVRAADQTTALQQRLSDRIEPLRLLEALTQLLPDDTALQSFKLTGTKVTIDGMTGNASALMQLLGSQSGLRDVRAPSAATRVAGTDKDAFAIEFTADPAQFGVEVESSAPVPAQAPPMPMPTPTPATTIPAAPAAAPAATFGGATFGGATFGGSPSARGAARPSIAPQAASPGRADAEKTP